MNIYIYIYCMFCFCEFSTVGNLEAESEELPEGTQEQARVTTDQEAVERPTGSMKRQREQSKSPNRALNEKLMEFLTK